MELRIVHEQWSGRICWWSSVYFVVTGLGAFCLFPHSIEECDFGARAT